MEALTDEKHCNVRKCQQIEKCYKTTKNTTQAESNKKKEEKNL